MVCQLKKGVSRGILFGDRSILFQTFDQVVNALQIVGRIVVDDDLTFFVIAGRSDLGAKHPLHIGKQGFELGRNGFYALSGKLFFALKVGYLLFQIADGKLLLYFDGRVPLPFFRVASNGTKALYTFFYWMKTATDVSLMFIDEFDAFYHYELAEVIVKLLEQMPSSQTILTSHNTNLLSNRIMRPDCYFILSENKLTSFANATRRELREGHNLEKLYMSGEFNG